MNGLYTEHCIKKNPSPLQRIGKFALIAVIILFIAGGFFLASGILIFLGMASIAAAYFLFPLFNIEYEYVFVDGQIDFDRICGQEKRKTMLRVDLDNIEIMAPIGSHRLDSYRNQQGLTVMDFTSNTVPDNVYGLFTSREGNKIFVRFEPSEKMLDYSRQKAPRKVFTD